MSFALWLTGLPCSGKSTIAKLLKNNVSNLEILDGDNLVKELKLKDWSKDSRIIHSEKVAYLAKSFLERDVSVCVAKISPFTEMRTVAKRIMKDYQFFEVYVECSLKKCEERDVKGLYKLAREGVVKEFTGISDPYEAPANAEIVIDSSGTAPEQLVDQIYNKIRDLGYI